MTSMMLPRLSLGGSERYRRPRSRNVTGDCDRAASSSKPLASNGVAGQMVIMPGIVVNHCSPVLEWPKAPPPAVLLEMGPPPPLPDLVRIISGTVQSP